MLKQHTYTRLAELIFPIAVVVLFLLPKLSAIALGILFLLQVYGLVKGALRLRIQPILVLFMAFYLAYLLGYFFGGQATSGAKYLEYKLGLLVIPLIFMFQPKEALLFRNMSFAYLGSIFLLFILGIWNGIVSMDSFTLFDSFTSSRFSFIHHPTYLSAYAMLGLELLRSGQFSFSFHSNKRLFIALALLFIIVQVLCFSLAGLLCLTLYLFVMTLWYSYRRTSKKVFVAINAFIVLLVFLVFLIPSPLKEQIRVAKDSLALYLDDPSGFVKSRQTYVTGNEVRLIMWTATVQEIKEHPMGVGTGNVDAHLSERLESLGQSPQFIAMEYNPHNQFLQTFLELGIFGFLILVALMYVGVRHGVKNRSTALIVLCLALLLHAFFESVFQRQSGVLFFTFWMCLLSSSWMFNKSTVDSK